MKEEDKHEEYKKCPLVSVVTFTIILSNHVWKRIKVNCGSNEDWILNIHLVFCFFFLFALHFILFYFCFSYIVSTTSPYVCTKNVQSPFKLFTSSICTPYIISKLILCFFCNIFSSFFLREYIFFSLTRKTISHNLYVKTERAEICIRKKKRNLRRKMLK